MSKSYRLEFTVTDSEGHESRGSHEWWPREDQAWTPKAIAESLMSYAGSSVEQYIERWWSCRRCGGRGVVPWQFVYPPGVAERAVYPFGPCPSCKPRAARRETRVLAPPMPGFEPMPAIEPAVAEVDR